MIHDVMVIGAGVAGTTAAAAAAGRGQRVILVERSAGRVSVPQRPDWLTSAAMGMLDELQVDGSGCVGEPFDGAEFFSADLSKSTQACSADSEGLRVDYGRLVRCLRARAVELGVECLEKAEPVRLDAGEDHVTAAFEDRDQVRARFMLIAEGAAVGLAGEAEAARRWVATLCGSAGKGERDQRMHWVLGLDGGKSLGGWWFDGPEAVIRLHGRGSSDAVREQLASLLTRMCERGLLPAKLGGDAARAELRPEPARLALEIDSHVGKRSLLIGDAGGFVAAASREGIYPAMWSAKLAGDVLGRAADSQHPQDELREFSASWRTTMAEYLRPPNTDLQFLLPLIFSNQQMAGRMAAAFWRGENI